ncbi:MAG: HAD family hydrolase [Tannerellaceae bacterium]|nr:HAD family hydrolase [Tannerellaceae bacterium]
MIEQVEVVGFDADDTLWVNELYFRETEQYFCELLAPYVDSNKAMEELYRTEMQNMPLYGYGVKAFILSVLETALRITSGQLSPAILQKLVEAGKEQLAKPVELLEGAEEVLNALVGRYRLILVTKGDLLDQERKLRVSGLEHLFHHVEIMSDKKPADYQKLLNHLDIFPGQFMMVGNSLRSDILPPLQLGCYAVHVPYPIEWLHEKVDEPIIDPRFYMAATLWDVISLLP